VTEFFFPSSSSSSCPCFSAFFLLVFFFLFSTGRNRSKRVKSVFELSVLLHFISLYFISRSGKFKQMNVRSNCLFSSRRASCSVSLCYFAEIYNSTPVLRVYFQIRKIRAKINFLNKISPRRSERSPLRSTVAKSRPLSKRRTASMYLNVRAFSCFTDYGFYYLGPLPFFPRSVARRAYEQFRPYPIPLFRRVPLRDHGGWFSARGV